ncbi:competence protein ComEA [Anaerosphaera aminiphila DSM 21120]|uniref:Competence protein ComEA n=1 Tax=Anaerosphaera aminiphila DSM 21120 TaxID=1120995 RepID=A0A1M5P1N6_9FIRM|nr:helix-hairpin-helix domain-containing protein [Anaerosphaera aminiphila]SHG95726.1 competence protein ComEA [Anaerosphaera aminiphila DSM 21120]
MKNLSSREKQIIALLAVVLIVFLASIFKDNFLDKQASSLAENNKQNLEVVNLNSDLNNKFNGVEDTEKIIQKENSTIYVHVCGRVKNPGLVELSGESRVIDAVNKAGGLYDDADIDNINLAKKVSDEERVYIPAIGEIVESSEGGISTENNNSKININTADKNLLQTLPGVGEKTAEKIIKHRETNSFKEIDDLKSVPGIGDKKFDELKDYIAVN